jgi:hypothetical protein
MVAEEVPAVPDDDEVVAAGGGEVGDDFGGVSRAQLDLELDARLK